MPLYEYQCSRCGNNFEVIQKFADPPVEKCPKCGGKVDKQLSAPAIQFKGQGWYITDYSRKGGESRPETQTETKPGETKTGETKPGETKPGETKPEAAKESSREPAKEPSRTDPKESKKKDSSSKEKAGIA